MALPGTSTAPVRAADDPVDDQAATSTAAVGPVAAIREADAPAVTQVVDGRAAAITAVVAVGPVVVIRAAVADGLVVVAVEVGPVVAADIARTE